uniref:Uncharacterized protein n=1 Tax=Arundo donax TaxID=35708 RepID=A0A0A9EPC0_ARUDO
MWLLQIEQTPH